MVWQLAIPVVGAYYLYKKWTEDIFDGFGAPTETAIVTSGWWEGRKNDVKHPGMDFKAKVGTPVYAVKDGTVIKADPTAEGPGGKWLGVEHTGGITSRYMHLSKLLVKKGAQVKRGDLIAYSGDTAVGSTGAHLHFDMKFTQAALDKFVKVFGKPNTGWTKKTEWGYGAPSEPIIPVIGYRQLVVDHAAEHGVPLFSDSYKIYDPRTNAFV